MSNAETTLQFIEHGGHRIAAVSGNPHAPGMPLVFLHGIAGSVDFWPPLLPSSIRDHRRWYSIGLPGHFPGELSPTDRPHDGLSADFFAELLAVSIRQLAPRQAVALIGYSTGGFAALNLAARAPELVATVVSVSGFAVGKWHGILGLLQSIASRGRAGRRSCATLWTVLTANRAVFRRLVLLNAKKLEPKSPERTSLLNLVARDAKRQRAIVLAELLANIRRFDIRSLLGGINVPTLIAGGDGDPIIQYRHTCELASEIRNAELVTFHGVGHLFFVECLDLFHQVLEDWIDRYCAV